MSRAWRIALIALVAVLAILLGAWLFSHVERSDVPRHVGLRGEAARNPLLAYERVLTELGVPAHSAPYVGVLPPHDHLLVLRDTGRFLSPAAVDQLETWVAEGGHLVLLLPNELDTREWLKKSAEHERYEVPVAGALGVRCIRSKSARDEQAVDFGHGLLQVDFDGPVVFDASAVGPDVVVGEPDGARLASFAHERGRVTLVATDRWIADKALDKKDHAEAAWQLAQLAGKPAGALLVYGERAPGFLVLVVEHGWMVIVAAAALLALYFVRVGARFGPPIAELDGGRRDFSEHVRAAGEFLWRRRALPALLDGPRRDLERKLRVARPDLADLPPAALAPALAELAGIDPERAALALGARQPRDDEFELVVRDLQLLRKAL